MSDPTYTLQRFFSVEAPTAEWAGGELDSEQLRREIERLQAIVDLLPKTADGVPITPGMDVFRCGGKLRSRTMLVFETWSNHCLDDCRGGYAARSCYSTKEAAEAASKDA